MPSLLDVILYVGIGLFSVSVVIIGFASIYNFLHRCKKRRSRGRW